MGITAPPALSTASHHDEVALRRSSTGTSDSSGTPGKWLLLRACYHSCSQAA
jgi:hypothetical protein